ncbi:MAG: hypothetical protein KDK36_09905 [Leptospiraceae bacterium]|nr:hypothetical protein [Leptospiraceae bacterium]
MKYIILILIISFGISSAPRKIKKGYHNLTLQWIEDGKPGKILFEEISINSYKVSGEKRSKNNEDFLKIDGTIKVIKPNILEFNGTIQTKIFHIYEGKVCSREGKQSFIAYGKRKYWRMKNKINCDERTTDYIDIYFR